MAAGRKTVEQIGSKSTGNHIRIKPGCSNQHITLFLRLLNTWRLQCYSACNGGLALGPIPLTAIASHECIQASRSPSSDLISGRFNKHRWFTRRRCSASRHLGNTHSAPSMVTQPVDRNDVVSESC